MSGNSGFDALLAAALQHQQQQQQQQQQHSMNFGGHTPPVNANLTAALLEQLGSLNPATLQLYLLSLLPQPPHTTSEPIMTRSGRPSRPPDETQANAGSFLDPAVLASLFPSGFGDLGSFNPYFTNGYTGTMNGLESVNSESNGAGLSSSVGPSHINPMDANSNLDWWWPLQEEDEDMDPSYQPPDMDMSSLFDAPPPQAPVAPSLLTIPSFQSNLPPPPLPSRLSKPAPHNSSSLAVKAVDKGKGPATSNPNSTPATNSTFGGSTKSSSPAPEQDPDALPAKKKRKYTKIGDLVLDEEGDSAGKKELTHEEIEARRKLRNRQSAVETRKRKKNYVKELEEKVEKLERELARVKALNSQIIWKENTFYPTAPSYFPLELPPSGPSETLVSDSVRKLLLDPLEDEDDDGESFKGSEAGDRGDYTECANCSKRNTAHCIHCRESEDEDEGNDSGGDAADELAALKQEAKDFRGDQPEETLRGLSEAQLQLEENEFIEEVTSGNHHQSYDEEGYQDSMSDTSESKVNIIPVDDATKQHRDGEDDDDDDASFESDDDDDDGESLVSDEDEELHHLKHQPITDVKVPEIPAIPHYAGSILKDALTKSSAAGGGNLGGDDTVALLKQLLEKLDGSKK